MSEQARGILSTNEYRSPRYRSFYAFCFLLGTALAATMLFPILWVLLSGLKPAADIYKVPQTLFPKTFMWENFAEAWRIYAIPSIVFNSFVVFLGVLVSKLLVITLAAYSLSKLELPARRAIYMVFLATLMLPANAYLVPSYVVVKDLGLYNTWWALWVPAGANSMQLLLMKGFFDGIPRELSEASYIDGASDGRILRSVVLPNSKPIIAVITIFTFLDVWNNFFWQRLVLVSPKLWTMAVELWYRSFVIGANPALNIQLTGMFISLTPPLVLFLLFQKYITEGVTLTGIKG
jgi:multiple sugar transport system permease protein